MNEDKMARTFIGAWVAILLFNLTLLGLIIWGIWLGIEALQKYIAS